MLGGDALRARRASSTTTPATPSSLVDLGEHGNGVPVSINRRWVEADLRITTGFVEPHFFAGFSGGPKLVAPGLAGLETVLVLHDAARIGDPRATWAVTHGNPVHDDIRAAAAAAPPHFSLDVILNREQRIIAAFAGETAGDARGRVRRPRAATRCGRGLLAVRRRRDEQLRLPARPEPLPGGQGHVGGRADRQARRHDRLRRRVPRRLPRPRQLPRAARLARLAGRADRRDHQLTAA